MSSWAAGENMTDFFSFLPGCTLQIKSLAVRPGCRADLWYGFGYAGAQRTYPAGVYTSVGAVMDHNVGNNVNMVLVNKSHCC